MAAESAWSETTGSTWDQGIVAGTGVVGAVLFGTPQHHRIALAHERFFLPANSRRPAPHLAPVLDEVRAALFAGDNARAADVVDRRLHDIGYPTELAWTDPLAPCAELSWLPATGTTRDYRREISLVNGDAATSWADADGLRSGISIRAERGLSAVVVQLWSEAELEGDLVLAPVGERRASGEGVGAVDYSGGVSVRAGASQQRLELEQSATGPEAGVSAAVVTVVERAEGSAAACEVRGESAVWRLSVGPGRPVELRVSLVVADDPGDGESAPTAEELLGRSRLDLGEFSGRSTEAVWAAARERDRASEREVLQLAYASGRRNIVASTGALPPTLQGVWQGTWSPAWSADYTLNGNVQNGSLASAIWTGTPELLRALFRLITPFSEHYRSNARLVFGVEGMMLPARMTTHGHANHFIRPYPHEFWASHGGWFLRFAADYISTTGDRALLHDWLWDFTREILDFGTEFLAAGGGHFAPSYSPENTPRGTDNPLAVDSTMDIAVLADGLRVGIWFAGLVGDDARAAAWSGQLDAVPPYRVAADGLLAEWASPDWPDELAHRHVSQLYPLWYDPDPAFTSPELRDAALATVRAKLAWRAEQPTAPPGRMEMAFGLVQLGLAAAALGDAPSAYQCALWLARDHWTPALVSTHDAGKIFNLDASGGLPAVVAAMLLGSSPGELRILAALPEQWPKGSVTGLLARGGLVVDLEWSPGRVAVTVRVLPGTEWLRDGPWRLVFPTDVAVVAGNGVRVTGPRTVEVEMIAPVRIEVVR